MLSAAQIEYMLAQMYDLSVMEREVLREGVTYECGAGADDELLAFAAWGPVAPATKLHKLYVDPAHQRRGLGSDLIEHVERLGRAAGARRLTLNVNKRNAGALAAYGRWGFAVASGVVVDIGGGFVMDDWIMEKPL
jgi:GNAT superfamily N-acetyltransferase